MIEIPENLDGRINSMRMGDCLYFIGFNVLKYNDSYIFLQIGDERQLAYGTFETNYIQKIIDKLRSVKEET